MEQWEWRRKICFTIHIINHSWTENWDFSFFTDWSKNDETWIVQVGGLPLMGLLYFLSLLEHLVPKQPLFWSKGPHGGLPGEGCWTITLVLDWTPLPQLLSQLDHSDHAESWQSTTAKKFNFQSYQLNIKCHNIQYWIFLYLNAKPIVFIFHVSHYYHIFRIFQLLNSE